MLRKTKTVDLPSGAIVVLNCGHTATRAIQDGDSTECVDCDRRTIPARAVSGRRTASFTATTTPQPLTRAHSTSAWAQLMVETGSVEFSEDGALRPLVASPDKPVVIVPGRPHHITPTADATFYVQFYNLDPGGIPPEDPTTEVKDNQC